MFGSASGTCRGCDPGPRSFGDRTGRIIYQAMGITDIAPAEQALALAAQGG